VSTSHVGTPLSPRNDYREFRQIVDRASLRRIRLHDLRHTAVEEIRALPDQRDDEHLQHVSSTTSREAVEQVDGLLMEPEQRGDEGL